MILYQQIRLSDTSLVGTPGPSTAPAAPARAILIRTVPRAAIAALVARLKREGVGHGG